MPEQPDTVIEVDVGAPAHGGSCVARYEGRVVFVRHALPGERVRARLTEDRGGSYVRADAVEVLRASPDRVPPPCPHAGPGRCGGCDWQHASESAQRELKAAVVHEQFARLAGLDVSDLLTGVEALPGGPLGWRTRITYAVGPDGRPGLHRHRSQEIEGVEACPLGVAGVGDSPVLGRSWPGLTGVEVVRGVDATSVLAHRPGPGRQARGRRPPDRIEVLEGPARLQHRLHGREFTVAADGFWQVHPHATQAFAAALLAAVEPRSGETVLDLYCGAGALTAVLADAVGPTGQVVGVESSRQAASDAAANLDDLAWTGVRRARVDAASVAGLGIAPDIVVLDPPRAGAGREVMAAILALQPRVVGYVACDPAALARDVRAAADAGWRLAGLRAFDAFPMTHHVECVAHLVPSVSPGA
ncbi:MAG: Deoxyribonuclease/rho motif-related [Pseudonocardiales bacterium]|nr:Deoxyribonuclease/rho motif-related [Pseudonocardiales bacterium]